VVWHDNKILGKPQDAGQAVAMLRQLRGNEHFVYTGLCVRHGEQVLSGYTVTCVAFGDASDEFIERYVATGEPMDKAGAYGAQGKGALLIERIEGDYWNVVGLPLRLLAQYLGEFGVEVDAFWAAGVS
jgi:septum formation protein